MDLQGGESGGVQNHTSPNTQRMGRQFTDVLPVINRVQIINSNSQCSHELLDVTCSDKFDSLGRGIPIQSQGGCGGIKIRLACHETGKSGQRSVSGTDKAIPVGFGVEDKFPLLIDCKILLPAPFDPDGIDLLDWDS